MAKERIWNNLKNKYKLSIFNETTYEELYSAHLSKMHFLFALSVLSIILITLTTLLIAFTGLREFIPGYPSGEMRQMITMNALRVDSLMDEIKMRDRYLLSLQIALSGEDSTTVVERRKRQVVSTDVKFDISQEEANFRSEVEERELFNLSFSGRKNEDSDFLHFFTPIEGVISRSFDEKERHYGTDVVAPNGSKVSSIADGVIIFTDWTINTGYVIAVQHPNNLLSIYKHNSTLLKNQGDYVRAGEVIALLGNTGEVSTGPHLHVEIWRAGTPLNPENFITFK